MIYERGQRDTPHWVCHAPCVAWTILRTNDLNSRLSPAKCTTLGSSTSAQSMMSSSHCRLCPLCRRLPGIVCLSMTDHIQTYRHADRNTSRLWTPRTYFVRLWRWVEGRERHVCQSELDGCSVDGVHVSLDDSRTGQTQRESPSHRDAGAVDVHRHRWRPGWRRVSVKLRDGPRRTWRWRSSDDGAWPLLYRCEYANG